MKPSVLVVDDDPDTLASLADLLVRRGYDPLKAASLREAQAAVETQGVDAILLDEHLPDGRGIEWIPELRRTRPRTAIIVITGAGDIPTAVSAMRQGADDFLTKPVNPEALCVVLEKNLELERLKWLDFARRRLNRKTSIFVGESAAARRMWELANTAAGNQATVLLQGETGTGKGVLAHWIHEHGPRQAKPLVEVNCSSLRGDLLASELFGHRKGAFTSALENREGLIEVADGGTLFLDEIGDMDLAVQAQFLKVIEDKQFRRVGESQVRRSDFRLLCATNRRLAEDCEAGRFRRDLYFRIYVFPLDVPPLRHRLEDLPALAEKLLAGLGRAEESALDEAVIQRLRSYDWPGNIRELRNVLERANLIAGARPLSLEHFYGLVPTDPAPPVPRLDESDWSLEAQEARHLRLALTHCAEDVNQTAKLLGISRATLYRKLSKYQLLKPK